MRNRRMSSRRSIRPRAKAAGIAGVARWRGRFAGDPPAGVAARGAPGARANRVEVVLDPARKYWLHVATGDVGVDGRALTAGDALGFADEAGTHRLEGGGDGPADVLFFDLPA